MIITDYFKYCPNCQNKLLKNSNSIFCSNCSFYFYHNPSPTNGVIFYNEKQEVLLVKRKFNPKKNYWDIPGGFINLNENLEESIKREIFEELSFKINLKKLKYLTSVNDYYQYKKIKQFTLCMIFTYQIGNEEIKKIKLNDDVSEYKFFSQKNIGWKKIAFSGIEKSLKLFFASF